MKKIQPITEAQRIAFGEYHTGKNLVLHGYAGTGKTLIAMYLGFEEIFSNDSPINNMLIVRSAVPTQDLGFLPGSYEEKIAPYEEPYDSICDFLFKKPNMYDMFKEQGKITFMPVAFIRGITIENTIIIVDEAQNLTAHQLNSIITRVGKNSKIIFCGDIAQSDLHKNSERAGFVRFMEVLEDIDEFHIVQFLKDDIVRSDLVRKYIIKAYEKGFMQ